MSRRNESRDKILEAAEQIFARKGYFSTSTDEIALKAGVAKGTLYYNFKSKGEIFETLVVEGIEGLHSQVHKTLSADLPLEEQLRNVIRMHLEYAINFPEMTRIFLSEMSAGLEENVREHVSRLRREYLNFLAPIVEDGQNLGLILPGDPGLIAHMLLSLLNSIECSDDQYPAEEVAPLLERMLLNGLKP